MEQNYILKRLDCQFYLWNFLICRCSIFIQLIISWNSVIFPCVYLSLVRWKLSFHTHNCFLSHSLFECQAKVLKNPFRRAFHRQNLIFVLCILPLYTVLCTAIPENHSFTTEIINETCLNLMNLYYYKHEFGGIFCWVLTRRNFFTLRFRFIGFTGRGMGSGCHYRKLFKTDIVPNDMNHLPEMPESIL